MEPFGEQPLVGLGSFWGSFDNETFSPYGAEIFLRVITPPLLVSAPQSCGAQLSSPSQAPFRRKEAERLGSAGWPLHRLVLLRVTRTLKMGAHTQSPVCLSPKETWNPSVTLGLWGGAVGYPKPGLGKMSSIKVKEAGREQCPSLCAVAAPRLAGQAAPGSQGTVLGPDPHLTPLLCRAHRSSRAIQPPLALGWSHSLEGNPGKQTRLEVSCSRGLRHWPLTGCTGRAGRSQEALP